MSDFTYSCSGGLRVKFDSTRRSVLLCCTAWTEFTITERADLLFPLAVLLLETRSHVADTSSAFVFEELTKLRVWHVMDVDTAAEA